MGKSVVLIHGEIGFGVGFGNDFLIIEPRDKNMNISEIKVGEKYYLGSPGEPIKVLRVPSKKDWLDKNAYPADKAIAFVVASLEDGFSFIIQDIAPHHAVYLDTYEE